MGVYIDSPKYYDVLSALQIIQSHEWACTFDKILWVIKQNIDYGPIREWVCTCIFA